MRCAGCDAIARFLWLAALPAFALAGQPDEQELHSTELTVEEHESGVTRTLEKKRTILFEAAPQTRRCHATLALQYLQHDDIATVSGVIENPDCDASAGEYTIVVRIQHQDGESESLQFGETWERLDDSPVHFAAEYPIGENVDLVTVHGRRLRCVCAGAAEE